MRVAIVGSRGLSIDGLEKYLPEDTDEIVSGGAKGIDRCARDFAISKGIKLTEFLPDYRRYGRWAAPIRRNIEIVEYADMILAFWDGKSSGTRFVIDTARRNGKPVYVHSVGKDGIMR